MISLPLSRIAPAFAISPAAVIAKGTVELSEHEAATLCRDLAAKLSPVERGKLLSVLESDHRRAGESTRDG
jgi:hypothetical protein